MLGSQYFKVVYNFTLSMSKNTIPFKMPCPITLPIEVVYHQKMRGGLVIVGTANGMLPHGASPLAVPIMTLSVS